MDSRKAQEEKPDTLVTVFEEPEDIKVFDGFKDMPEAELKELYGSLGLAMTFKDFMHIQNYYKGEEHRDVYKSQDGEPDVIVDEIKGVLRELSHIDRPVNVHLAQAKCYAYF